MPLICYFCKKLSIMNKFLLFTSVALLGLFVYSMVVIDSLNKKYETAMANVKAYDKELSASKEKNTAFQLTVDQLNCFSDSVLTALKETKEELKIKDKNLKSLHAVNSSFERTDTVVFNDTIFLSPSLAVDTVLGDEWYSLNLSLRYPSVITASPSYTSKKHILVSLKKETVNPPKKYWIQRIFQKKHKVLKVDVVEKNPYVKDESSKFVEVLK